MSWLIEVALANAAVAILLAAVISLVGRWVRRPALLHVLWVLVLIKLITPPLLPIDIPVPSSWAGNFGVHEPTVSSAPEAPATALNASPPKDLPSPTEMGEFSGASAPTTPSGAEGEVSRPPRSVVDMSHSLSASVFSSGAAAESLPGVHVPPHHGDTAIATNVNQPVLWSWMPTLLMGICAAGSLLWWGLCAYRIAWFKHRLIRLGSDDPPLANRVAELAQQLGLSRVPFVRVVDEAIAPMLWGCWRWTWIVLPRRLLKRLDDDARDAMLLHELAHFARGDHWVRLLELLVTGLYWWHPVVWWARRQIAICEEECCDARVVSLSRSPRRYAEVLLETLDFVADFRPVLSPIASGMSDVPILERRLRQIMAGVTPWNLPRAGRWGLIGLAALLPCNPLLSAAVSHATAATDRARPAAMIEPASARVPDGATPFADLDQLHDESASLRPPAETATTASWPGLTDHPLLRTGPTRDDWGTAASGSERFRLAASSGGRVQLRDASTGRSVDLTETGITAAAFLPRERMLVGTKTGDVRVYDAASAAPVSFLGRHRDEVTSVCISPGGRLAVTGSRDGSVFVWDLDESGAIRHEWKISGAVSVVRCSPDGRTLAVACGDWLSARSTVVLLDIDSGRLRHELAVVAPIGGLAFRSEGQLLLAADWNGLVTFWNVATGELRGRGQVTKDAVSDASFSPDNDALSDVIMNTPEEPQ